MKKYHYKAIDNSTLTPWFRDKLAVGIARRLSLWVRPNLLTGFSFILMNSLWILPLTLRIRPLTFILCGLIVVIYQLFDTIDGALARERGLSTALGEFFDHFHDILGNGLVLFMFMTLFQVSNGYIITTLFAYQYFFQAKTFSYQKHTSYVVFDRFGPVEGCIVTGILLISSSFEPVYTFMIAESWRGVSHFEWIYIIVGFTHGIQTIFFLTKDNVHHPNFFFYTLLMLSFYFTIPVWDLWQIALVFIPFNMLFIGRVIRSHLFEEPYPLPDWIGPIAILVLPRAIDSQLLAIGLPTAYLWTRSIFFYIQTVTALVKNAPSKDN